MGRCMVLVLVLRVIPLLQGLQRWSVRLQLPNGWCQSPVESAFLHEQ